MATEEQKTPELTPEQRLAKLEYQQAEDRVKITQMSQVIDTQTAILADYAKKFSGLPADLQASFTKFEQTQLDYLTRCGVKPLIEGQTVPTSKGIGDSIGKLMNGEPTGNPFLDGLGKQFGIAPAQQASALSGPATLQQTKAIEQLNARLANKINNFYGLQVYRTLQAIEKGDLSVLKELMSAPDVVETAKNIATGTYEIAHG